MWALVQQRVAAMSDEITHLSGKIDKIASSGLRCFGCGAICIYRVTGDGYFGLTKVFPFTRSVR